jgi:DNA replication protein DnaC
MSGRDEKVFVASRIPPRYKQCDFSNFEVDVHSLDRGRAEGEAFDQSLREARVIVEAFAHNYPVGSETGILLMGPCGVGKTHLAVSALKEVVQRGHSGLFCDYRELLKEIQASYDPSALSSEMQILDPVLNVELLLLDDLGASKPSSWTNARYNNQRTTVVTTNYLDSNTQVSELVRAPSGPAVQANREESLADRVGHRIRSRLFEMCRTIEIQALDYRREVRQAGRFRA